MSTDTEFVEDAEDTEAGPLGDWAYRVAFARHFGEARRVLDRLPPPDPGHRADVVSYVQLHLLAAIAASLDPDTAATVASGTDRREETVTQNTP